MTFVFENEEVQIPDYEMVKSPEIPTEEEICQMADWFIVKYGNEKEVA